LFEKKVETSGIKCYAPTSGSCEPATTGAKNGQDSVGVSLDWNF